MLPISSHGVQYKVRNDLNAPPPLMGLSNINLKPEILDDDFCIDNLSSSKGYLQDFQNLDQFPLTAPSFNLDTVIQSNGFDPFYHVSSVDFGLYDYKPYEENGSISAAMQDFQVGEFLNFPNRKNSLMEIETALKYHDLPLSFVVPDESSCVTADNLGSIQSLNSNESEFALTKRSGRGQKKSKSAKGQWTIEEDRLLIHLVEKYGVRKWSNIAQMLKGRIGKQCRERWHNHLRPDIKKDVWTEDEDRILIEVHAKVGNKWAEIAKKTKWPRPSSLLQNYIKSLNFEKETSCRKIKMQPDNNTSIDAPQNPEIEFCPDDYKLPQYDFDEIVEFTFDDENIFRGSSVDSFTDDISLGPPPEIDDKTVF
ncbi:hypothetical protein DH2020_028483 [Rehmannia glutinosa]|uniref:R2R3-MYB protein n=1 Tax=Rehmannia glutinosa TaxID=99300 RepID=A0ABR0VR91_REHGL